jgi:hypothetical protein
MQAHRGPTCSCLPTSSGAALRLALLGAGWIWLSLSLSQGHAALVPAVGAVHDGDAVVTFNFRADRMVEISKVIRHTGSRQA